MSNTTKLGNAIEEALNDAEYQLKADAPGVAPDWYTDLKIEWNKYATLIEAAPDLLNSLREARNQMELFKSSAEDAGVADMWDEIIERADAAINKAKFEVPRAGAEVGKGNSLPSSVQSAHSMAEARTAGSIPATGASSTREQKASPIG